MQSDWILDDVSTWAARTVEPLSEDDERMVSASSPLLPLGLTPGWDGAGRAAAREGSSSFFADPEARESSAPPSMLPPRPATAAAESVSAFLNDPDTLARMEVGDEVSTDGSGEDDADIPEVLRVPLQHAAVRGAPFGGSLAGGSQASMQCVSRPQTCRGSRNRLDGPVASPTRGVAGSWGGRLGTRPQTAHAGTTLSAKEKLERRKAYKAPRPPTDGLGTFSRAAQARFRT